MRRVLPVLSLLWLLTWASPLHALTGKDVQGFTLKNGMRFLVLEDHAIPSVTLQIFFRVGSRNEGPGMTGLSHFLEHMMFNGARKYGPKMFDRVLESAGGSSNAYTSYDITAYQDWVPRSALERVFEMEADRIAALALDEAIVESERGVVLSEYTTGYENSDYDVLEDQLRSVAFHAHPYRWPVIGFESDIRSWTRADVKDYFDRYYAPNNALAVVVGDVTLDEVRALAEKYLEPIPARKPPRPVHTREPEQKGEKRLMVQRNVSTPHVLIAYHVPETGSEDYYALELLSAILSEGNSSRLYRALVSGKQLATEVSSYLYEALDPTLFFIYAVCADGVEAKTLEKAMLREIDRIAARGVTQQELQKARNNAVASFWRSLLTMSDKADRIGTYEIFFGGYAKLFEAPERVRRVSAEDVRTAAARYFRKNNRTIGILRKDEGK
ncbi:MAG: Protease 3 precursor [Syntrophaceae bacterium PtaU1.Bin231]|nr:MAG: Protease 3 precursor [Syntrophaceae bacterium PtaU1.Bin231]